MFQIILICNISIMHNRLHFKFNVQFDLHFEVFLEGLLKRQIWNSCTMNCHSLVASLVFRE